MQKVSRTPTSIQMIVHCGMGVILGAIFGLALIYTDKSIFQFVVASSSPLMDVAVVAGFFSFVIGMGATLSGFVFSTIELSALEAKQRIEPFKKRSGSGT